MPVKKQHVVSRTVLKRWTDADGNLASFDLRNGKLSLKSPGGSGYVEWFVMAEYSAVIEQVWKEAEDRAPELIRRIEAGTAFDDDTIAGIRELVAIHLVRSKPMAAMWRIVHAHHNTAGRLAQIRQTFSSPAVHRRFAEERTGLILPFGDIPPELGAGPALAKVERDAAPSGPWFVDRALATQQDVLALLRTRFMEIGHDAAGGLVIGDSPATTYQPSRNRAGLLAGANWTDSTILMPVTPSFVVAFSKRGGPRELTSADVNRLNDIQLATAEDHIYAVPGSAAAHELALALADVIGRRD